MVGGCHEMRLRQGSLAAHRHQKQSAWPFVLVLLGGPCSGQGTLACLSGTGPFWGSRPFVAVPASPVLGVSFSTAVSRVNTLYAAVLRGGSGEGEGGEGGQGRV